MKKPVMSLLAPMIIASVFSCNTETSVVTTDKDSASQNQAQTFDSDQTTEAKKPIETTVNEPATPKNNAPTPKVEDHTFNKVLSYKGISFKVTADGKGSLQRLTIQPSGLSADNKAVTLDSDPVVDAVADDLNADGFPELLVFTQSAGSGSYGKVIAYSVNNGKSMSRVTFPATGDNDRINKGYMGHDRFTVADHQLTQIFPIYKKSDTNADDTKKERVVSYKLINGEASRVFVVNKVKEMADK